MGPEQEQDTTTTIAEFEGVNHLIRDAVHQLILATHYLHTQSRRTFGEIDLDNCEHRLRIVSSLLSEIRQITQVKR